MSSLHICNIILKIFFVFPCYNETRPHCSKNKCKHPYHLTLGTMLIVKHDPSTCKHASIWHIDSCFTFKYCFFKISIELLEVIIEGNSSSVMIRLDNTENQSIRWLLRMPTMRAKCVEVGTRINMTRCVNDHPFVEPSVWWYPCVFV